MTEKCVCYQGKCNEPPSILPGAEDNCVLGMQVQPTAQGARNFSQCDSMLIGDNAGANTYPYIQVSPYRRVCVLT